MSPDLLGALGSALHSFATPELWFAIIIGTLVGGVFGIIPGISGLTAIALLLPFVFKMSAWMALPLIMTIMLTQFQGGAISAILLNLPGTPGNVATLLDGYPMTQKGQGGRALGAAQMSHGLSAFTTTAITLAFIPLLLPLVMAITSADMVFMMLLGLSFISTLATQSLLKGLISGGIGILLAFIGYQPSTGVARFTFGSLYLYDGLDIVPVTLGLFAFPEMIALATKGGTIVQGQAVKIKGMGDVMEGAKDVFRHWWLVLRCNVVGWVIGVLPGIGASAASFICYAQAKKTSRHPEEFGHGAVEGIIAPESANNSETMGALLTTLAVGIPGNAVMALMLGAMLMLDIIPGPEMLTRHMDLSLTLILLGAVSGISALCVYIPLSPYLSGVARVPGRLLVPLVIAVLCLGAFASQGRMNDVYAALVVGVFGVILRRYDYNRPALFLGFILSGLVEKFFYIALKGGGPLFFMRPISLFLILMTLLVILWSPVKGLLQRRKRLARA